MIPYTEAIVLKTFDVRETSKIAVFYTKEYGKVTGVLKGIRKDPRKFGSSLDRFSVNDIVFYRYRNKDVHLISQCDLKEYFFLTRQDYKRTVAANYGLELVDTIMQAEQVNKKIYSLILQYLHSLEEYKDIDKLVHIFQIKILLLSGFRPHIDSCVQCNKKIFGKVRFSMKLGGLICQDCPTRETSFTIVSPGAVSSILHIEKNSWEKALCLGLDQSIKKELKYILNNFLVYHLEKRIKSSQYL